MIPIICAYVSLSVQTALKFRKQTMSVQFYNLKFHTYTIICGVKLLSFGISYCLLSFSDLFRTPVESPGIL